MARGNGWDKKFTGDEEERRKKWVVSRPEVTLSGVEWVIVDEADVLFGALLETHIETFLTYMERP